MIARTVSASVAPERVVPLWLPASWALLHLMDALLTLYILGLGGREGNPLLVALQGPLGDAGMLAAKLLGAALAGIVLWRLRRRAMLLAGNALMLLVVLYNASLLAYVWATGARFL